MGFNSNIKKGLSHDDKPFKVVLPLTQQAPYDVFAAGLVDEGQDDGRDQPADRIGRHEDQEVAVSRKHGVQPSNADTADAGQDDDSRRQGIAIAAQGAGNDVDDAVEI